MYGGLAVQETVSNHFLRITVGKTLSVIEGLFDGLVSR